MLVVPLYFDRHFSDVEGGHIYFFTRAALKTLVERFGFVVYQKRRAVRRAT